MGSTGILFTNLTVHQIDDATTPPLTTTTSLSSAMRESRYQINTVKAASCYYCVRCEVATATLVATISSAAPPSGQIVNCKWTSVGQIRSWETSAVKTERRMLGRKGPGHLFSEDPRRRNIDGRKGMLPLPGRRGFDIGKGGFYPRKGRHPSKERWSFTLEIGATKVLFYQEVAHRRPFLGSTKVPFS